MLLQPCLQTLDELFHAMLEIDLLGGVVEGLSDVVLGIRHQLAYCSRCGRARDLIALDSACDACELPRFDRVANYTAPELVKNDSAELLLLRVIDDLSLTQGGSALSRFKHVIHGQY